MNDDTNKKERVNQHTLILSTNPTVRHVCDVFGKGGAPPARHERYSRSLRFYVAASEPFRHCHIKLEKFHLSEVCVIAFQDSITPFVFLYLALTHSLLATLIFFAANARLLIAALVSSDNYMCIKYFFCRS